jgi:hypothetical protein
MKLRTLAMLFFLLSFYFKANGQDTGPETKKSQWDVGLEGMIGFSAGNNFYSMNVGGPSLLLSLTKDLKIGVGALPSISSLNGKLGARLGVTPRIDYKNLVFTAPFFHRDVTDEWIRSIGIGYKFHKKKTN